MFISCPGLLPAKVSVQNPGGKKKAEILQHASIRPEAKRSVSDKENEKKLGRARSFFYTDFGLIIKRFADVYFFTYC